MRRRMLAAMAAFVGIWASSFTSHAATCESLVLASSPGATVVGAATVLGPQFTAPDGVTYSGVPTFCKVSAVLTPTADSFINVELWMPSGTWNGRFEGVGNGGYAGTIALGIPAMINALQSGRATATTDMGTVPSGNNNGDALVGHPQKWIDWGWRATHLMTTLSKQLMVLYYGTGPRYSYFNGCSTGGSQALMEAQRFPDDYDGILGGDPANNRTHVHTAVLWNYATMRKTPQVFFSSGQTANITASVLAACAMQSGGLPNDPYLTDPRSCTWDPSAVQCPPGTSDGKCLAPEQVDAARKMYAGPRNPRTGALIFPGTAKGAEADTQFGWSGNSGSAETPFGSIFKWVFGLTFTYMNFNFDSDMAAMDSILAPSVNANSADLSAFRDRGGKFIMYQGWADPLVPPQDSINYYERIVAAQGNGASAVRKAQSFYRLFMVPGMYHCAFGPGPNAFGNRFSGKVYAAPPGGADASNDIFIALQDWVEKGVAPTRVTATKYVQDVQQLGVQMTRPICVYPNVAKYSGTGDPNRAENFVCAPAAGATDPAQRPAPEYYN